MSPRGVGQPRDARGRFATKPRRQSTTTPAAVWFVLGVAVGWAIAAAVLTAIATHR